MMTSTPTTVGVCRFFLNNELVTVDGADPLAPLVNTIRERCHAKATKVGCNQGNCGACTVTIAWPEGDPRYTKAPICVNACLFPTGGVFVDPLADPAAVCPKVTTVEGAMKNDRMASAAKTIAECNGTQCGICTAGMVMKAAYYEGEVQAGLTNCTVRDVEDLLEGNLCRCTGFRPILYALKKHFVPTTDPNYDKVAAEIADTPDLVQQGLDDAYLKCYATGDYASKNVFVPKIKSTPDGDGNRATTVKSFRRGESSQGNAFLRLNKGLPIVPRDDNYAHELHGRAFAESPTITSGEPRSTVALRVGPPVVAPTGRGGVWVAPYTVKDVIGAMQNSLNEGRQFQLVAGNCASAWSRLYEEPPNHDYISVAHVAELQRPVELKGQQLRVSSGTTMQDWLKYLSALQKAHPDDQSLDLVIQHSFATANIQVRSLGTIAGNVIYANTRKGILHSDISLTFAALGAMMVYTTDGVTERHISVAEFQQNVTPIQGVWLCKYFTLMVPLQNTVTVHVARTGDRNENFPTSCSAAYSCVANSDEGHVVFTGPHHLADGSAIHPAPILLAIETPLPRRDPIRALQLIQQELATNPQLVKLAAFEKQLMVHMSARVLTVDNGATGVQMPSMLEERKVECQTKNAQSFYVDPIESPLTEPLVKRDAYLAVSGTAVYPMDIDEAGMVNAAPVLSPVAILTFCPYELEREGRRFVRSMDPTADFFTAASMPYDPAVDTDVAGYVSMPWVKSEVVGDEKRMFTGRNILFGDYAIGGNAQYGVREALKPNPGKDASNKYGPGGFGEFVVAPGFTTHQGQIIGFVVHVDETKARGLASQIGRQLELLLQPGGHDAGSMAVTIVDRTSELGILDIASSRRMSKAILGPEVQSPSVFARGLATFNDASSKKEYEDWWSSARSDPANIYVELLPGDFTNNALEFEDARREAQLHAEAQQTKAPVIPCAPITASAQAHFYMETQVCVISAINEGRYRVTTATQGMTDVSVALTRVLNVPARDIVAVHNRTGGGFGGKAAPAMQIAACCGFVHMCTKKPARLSLERRVDLQVCGKGHLVQGRYRAVVRGDPTKLDYGTILGMDLWYDGDAGCGTFFSPPVIQFSGLIGDNVYNVPNFRIEGNVYLTHKQSSTALRTFGGIQALTLTETAVDHAYSALRQRHPSTTLSAERFRAVNFYRKSGNVIPTTPWRSWITHEPNAVRKHLFLHYHQELVETDIMTGNDENPGVWQTTVTSADYVKARQECNDFNATNAFRKRGIAVMPLKYAGGWDPKDTLYGFGGRPYDQSSALVNIYKDGGNYPGYVLVHQSGVEMGQGLFVMLQQVAAATLNIPCGIVRIAPMSTDTVPNQISTGASTAFDGNAVGVRHACTKLRDRLHLLQDRTLRREATKRLSTPSDYDLAPSDVAALQELVNKDWDPKTGFSAAGDVTNPSKGWTTLQLNAMQHPIRYEGLFTHPSPGRAMPPGESPSMYAQTPLGSYQLNYYLQAFRSWKVPEPIKGQYDQWSFDYNITRQTYLDSDNYEKGVYDDILAAWSPSCGLADLDCTSGAVKTLMAWMQQQVDDPATPPTKKQSLIDLITYLELGRPVQVAKGREPAPLTLAESTRYWSALINEANGERVLLSAVGQGLLNAEGEVVPDAHDWFMYFIYGSAWSVVEVDGITGQTDVLRSDIFYDAGNSPNPAADIGQVEGAFVQGLGNIMTEQCDWNPKTGVLNQPSIMDVAIPDQRMIPRSLRTHLFWLDGPADVEPGKGGDGGVHIDLQRRNQINVWNAPRAKAASEASMCMSVVLLMAVRSAVAELRKGLFQLSDCEVDHVPLSTPLVPSRVLEAIYGVGGTITPEMLSRLAPSKA